MSEEKQKKKGEKDLNISNLDDLEGIDEEIEDIDSYIDSGEKKKLKENSKKSDNVEPVHKKVGEKVEIKNNEKKEIVVKDEKTPQKENKSPDTSENKEKIDEKKKKEVLTENQNTVEKKEKNNETGKNENKQLIRKVNLSHNQPVVQLMKEKPKKFTLKGLRNRVKKVINNIVNLDFIEDEEIDDDESEKNEKNELKTLQLGDRHPLVVKIFNILRKLGESENFKMIINNSNMEEYRVIDGIIEILLNKQSKKEYSLDVVFRELPSIMKYNIIDEYYSFSEFQDLFLKNATPERNNVLFIKFLLQRKALFSICDEVRKVPNFAGRFYLKDSIVRSEDDYLFFLKLLLMFQNYTFEFKDIPELFVKKKEEIVNQLKKNITMIVTYFLRRIKIEKLKLKEIGNEKKNKKIGNLIRDNFCRALKIFFNHGLKKEVTKFVIFEKTMHIWKVFQKIIRSESIEYHDYKVVFAKKTGISIEMLVKTVDSFFLKVRNDSIKINLKFNCLICYCLNRNVLLDFINIVMAGEKLLEKFYNENALIRDKDVCKKIKKFIEPLHKLPFDLIIQKI